MLLYAQASLPLLWLPLPLPPSTMSLKQMPRYLRLSVREIVQQARLCMSPMMSPACMDGEGVGTNAAAGVFAVEGEGDGAAGAVVHEPNDVACGR